MAESGREIDSVVADARGVFDSFSRVPVSNELVCCFDGHVHTGASDGERTPVELAFQAHQGGLSVVVADHYSIDGAVEAMREFSELSAHLGSPGGASVMAGIELSVRLPEDDFPDQKKMHLLGVGVSTGRNRLTSWLSDHSCKKKADTELALKIIERLRCECVVVDSGVYERIRHYRNVYKAIAKSIMSSKNIKPIRNHLGVCLNQSRKKFRNKRGHHLNIEREVIRSLRSHYGDLATDKPFLEDAIRIIKSAGGAVVVPHILSSNPQMRSYSTGELIEYFETLSSFGVDGVEAYHPAHDIYQADKVARTAKMAGLMVLGGSDAHLRSDALGVFTRESITWCSTQFANPNHVGAHY